LTRNTISSPMVAKGEGRGEEGNHQQKRRSLGGKAVIFLQSLLSLGDLSDHEVDQQTSKWSLIKKGSGDLET